MKNGLNRRRFLTISAAAAALPGSAWAQPPVARWRGQALGAAASMTLVGMTDQTAHETFAAVEAEVSRLERTFSLYRPGSAVSRLNETGRLASPPAEMLELLGLSQSLHQATGGAFDPTIQPLWELHALSAARGDVPEAATLAEARSRCGWNKLHYDATEVSFSRKGMALTFNGIAQGFIADRVAALLRRRGLRDLLIDMGEIAALGRRPDGGCWRAGIATPEGEIVRQVQLAERALATSAPLGTLLDPAGRVGHILDPRSGEPGGQWRLVSLAAERAALADGLSTAFCLMDHPAITAALARYPDVSLEALL